MSGIGYGNTTDDDVMEQTPTNAQVDPGIWSNTPGKISSQTTAAGGSGVGSGTAAAPGSSSTKKGEGPLAGGRQITRNRASYSCHSCRRRKVKCDKVHPVCGNCAKGGTECVYDAVPQQKNAGSEGGGQSKGGHGTKRRRETSRYPEEGSDELQSIYNHLQQDDLSDIKNGGDSQGIEARLAKLTSVLEHFSKSNEPLDASDRQLLAQNARIATTQGNPLSISRPGTPPHRPADSAGDEFPIPSGHETDLVDPVGSLNLGHLSLEDGGKSRYVGTTYWAYISHEINELNQLLRDQNRSHEVAASDTAGDDPAIDAAARTPGASSADDHSTQVGSRSRRGESQQDSLFFSSSESPNLKHGVVEAEVLEHMPTKRQSHVLYKGFMSGVHAISPVIHPPTILKLYNAFWDWYDHSSYSGDPCPDPSFIPLLYAIWCGGSVTVSMRTLQSEFDTSSRSTLLNTFNEEATKWLDRVRFPRSASLQGLAAYLIVQTILSKEEEPLTSSLFISLSMRVAQTMGLHRDPAKFGIEPCEAEYRRRLWWHIVHMDGVVAMSSGLPPLVSDENYWDVRETSEIKDTLLGTSEADNYEHLVSEHLRLPDVPDDPTTCNGPSMVNVYYLSARGKYVMARAVRRILKIQLGTKPVMRRDMEELKSILLKLQLDLNSIINRIPVATSAATTSEDSPSFPSWSPVETRTSDTELPGQGPNGCAEQYQSPVLVAFHKWARILLSLFIDKAYCVAYQPFLKNAKSRIWPTARQSAIRHCHGFMEKFISLASDPDFQPFQWSWPGNHQPMHATMVMLIDLYERPHSPEAPKSRAFIDKIFSLTGPDGGVVGGENGISTQRPLKDGGREAWDMIRRLRHKAWQKAGLDPHKLWTEQAQAQAGVVVSGTDDHPASAPAPASVPLDSSSSRSERSEAVSRQLANFSKTFHDITRSQKFPSSPNPPPPEYQAPLPNLVPNSIPPTPNFPQALQTLDTTLAGSNVASPAPHPSAPPPQPPAAAAAAAPAPPTVVTAPAAAPAAPFNPSAPFIQTPDQQPFPIMDTNTFPPHLHPDQSLATVPTPPSMVDPNLNFDWDQWDAVFGQHLPVADDLMELDPVTGLEFADPGNGNTNNMGFDQGW